MSCSKENLEKLLKNLQYISKTPNTSREDQQLIKESFKKWYDLLLDLDSYRIDILKYMAELQDFIIDAESIKKFEARYKEFWDERYFLYHQKFTIFVETAKMPHAKNFCSNMYQNK